MLVKGDIHKSHHHNASLPSSSLIEEWRLVGPMVLNCSVVETDYWMSLSLKS